MQLFLTVALELVAFAFTLLLVIEFSWGIYQHWQDVAVRTGFTSSTTLWNEYHKIFLNEIATTAFTGVVEAAV
ncbi:MAG: hypothetical protein CLLPBCKN_006167 [Chroococcidiopsis cubana SAG 39.79]|uniref:Uncharacterized protein n=1 Tax=Chroococcidiopsis cubana SAG 39.79 TaxID=388085 RepID=A0AB37UGV6_9CYAN|nr:hypothetical protein [Chroococcidiopsis cubana]MDZ4876732.1 hypothetical protein [Chroococcidiopsis cubana SAG 39.79]PSB65947.1 hypothetical protein C7B79_03165 [Chroococcidiopsis cubana CCALA 043]RUT10575.1 hypothetical protein DSM107010_41420 [Chroococcidiopsis cubana SAG 39.79]